MAQHVVSRGVLNSEAGSVVVAGAQAEHFPDQQQAEQVSEEGVVTEWKEDGGYGFLTMDDGRRAYVHRRVLWSDRASLVIGARMRVTIGPDLRDPGKWCVESVLRPFVENAIRALSVQESNRPVAEEGVVT